MCCHSVFHRYPYGGFSPMPMFWGRPCMPPMMPYNNCCFGNMGNSFAVGAGIGLGFGVANLVGGLINRFC